MTKRYDDKVQSVTKALIILEELSKSNDGLGLIELSKKTEMNKTTVYRLLTSLMDRDFVQQDPNNGKYTLGIKILSIANSFYQRKDIRVTVREILDNPENNDTILIGKIYRNSCTLIDVININENNVYNIGEDLIETNITVKSLHSALLPKWGANNSNKESSFRNNMKRKEELRLIYLQGYVMDEIDDEIYLALPVFDYTKEATLIICVIFDSSIDKNMLSSKTLKYQEKASVLSSRLGSTSSI